MNEAEYLEAATEDRRHLPDPGMAKMLRCRERFSGSRKDGARRMRGGGDSAKGMLWSVRDLRVGI